MIDSVKALAEKIEDFLKDVSKLEEKGNKAAGKRVRKHLLDFMKLGKAGRKEVSELIKSIPSKRK